MAVNFIGSDTAIRTIENTDSVLTLNNPGAAEDDLIIIWVVTNLLSFSVVPSGFQSLYTVDSPVPYLWTYYKIATNSEPTTYEFRRNNSTTSWLSGGLIVYRGVDVAATINAFGYNPEVEGHTVTTPSITATDVPVRLMYARAARKSDSGVGDLSFSTVDSEVTKRFEIVANPGATTSYTAAQWERNNTDSFTGVKSGLQTTSTANGSNYTPSNNETLTIAILGTANIGTTSSITVEVEMGDAEPTFKACGANLSPTIELSAEAFGSFAFLEMRPMLLVEVGSLGIGEPFLSAPSHLVSIDEDDIDDEGEEDGDEFLVGIRLGITEKYEVAGMGI